MSAYAVSKLAGELYARAYLDNALIVRTSGVYGPGGRKTARGNFVELMMRLAASQQPIRVVQDHVASPTFAPLLAARAADLVERGQTGVFHIGGGAPISWFQFARLIFQAAGVEMCIRDSIYILPTVFSVYRGLFPAVQLQVDRSYATRVVEAVAENSADFGLTQLPVDEKRLQVVDIHKDEICAIVPAGHPLAGRKMVEAQEVTEFYLLLPKQGKTRTRLNQWLEPVEERIRISMELDSTEMMKRFVIAGLGVSFLAASNCREEVAAGRLSAITLAPEPMVRRLGLIYRRDKALSKAALGFIQVVMENVGEVSARSRAPKVVA